MPIIGSINDIVSSKKLGEKDNTINGKCSKCGECCTSNLVLTKNEHEKILKHVIENNIKPTVQGIPFNNYKSLVCPFLDENNRCKIYKVRPHICKKYICNKKVGRKFYNKYKDGYLKFDMNKIFEGVRDYEKNSTR